MAEIDGRHLFRYVTDPSDEVSKSLGKPAPLRPAAPVGLAHLGETTIRVMALMDSGSERCFASPALARSLRLDLRDVPSAVIGLGGGARRVQFVTVTLQLFESMLNNEDSPISEWQADVAFLSNWDPPWAVLLGRDGFFDQFTVTMHGGVPAVMLEPWETFDERFGLQIEEADNSQPRFDV